MKTVKKTLSLILALVMILSLCACGANSSITKAEVAQMIEDSNDIARSAGYFEGLYEGLSHADACNCGCPNCSNSNPAPTTLTVEDAGNEPNDAESNPSDIEDEPEVIREEHLPILMTYSGTWLDQNGGPMSYADAQYFFEHNREYAKVAVAINSLCEELQSGSYQYNLDKVYSWATASPHDTDEYLAYEWILSEMGANYDNYLNDLLALIGDQIDFDSSPAANVATCIILEKMLEFRDDGTYEASINPHRKHDCEAEGYNRANATIVTVANKPASATAKNKDEVDWSSMTTAEIITYLNAQRTTPETDFDLQHPNLYFDRLGRVYGAIDFSEEYYYATSDGRVYQLDSRTDVDRIGESPLFDASLRGTYIGTTNRILK